ncbi:MAG: hypothetical protein SFV23_27020 [Planctomycetaceae bacterium]|nr:hypothetical protein [Planctomycetaceae bacterium]
MVPTLFRAVAGIWLAFTTSIAFAADPLPVKRVAGVVTEYRRNSHADVILSRLLETETLDGHGRRPSLQLVSLYVDQTPPKDLSRELSAKYGFRLCRSIGEALTLGTAELAVDGVLMIAEHGDYPESPAGQTQYPKRRFFTEIVEVFEHSQRTVPVFSDKHLADNTADAVWFYETAQRLKVPLMAGSSVTSTWRDPALDVLRDESLQEIVVLSYGGLEAYGFHALDLLQSLAERRLGGETGVARVRTLTGKAVWETARSESFDPQLLAAAIGRLKIRPIPPGRELRELVPEPVAYVIDYRDGLRGTVLTLNGAIAEWAVAWRGTPAAEPQSFAVDLQDDRPFMHFAHLLHGIEGLMQTRTPTWPVERTLFSSVMLDAALTSKLQRGAIIQTPVLQRRYRSTWNWTQPDDAGREPKGMP